MALFGKRRPTLPSYVGTSLDGLRRDATWAAAIRAAGLDINQCELVFRLEKAMVVDGRGSMTPQSVQPALLLGEGDILAIAYPGERAVQVVKRPRAKAELQTQRSGTFQVLFGPLDLMDFWVFDDFKLGTPDGEQFGQTMLEFLRGRLAKSDDAASGLSAPSAQQHAAPSAPHTGLLAPVIVNQGDIEKVDELLGILDEAIAQRSTDRTYDFGIQLNRAGGFPNIDGMSKYEYGEAMLEVTKAGAAAFQRPWLWLAAVAREALGRSMQAHTGSDVRLVGRISAATWIWTVEFAPKMNAGAFFEGVVTAPDRTSLAQIFSTGIQAATVADIEAQLFAGYVVENLAESVEPSVFARAQQLQATRAEMRET